MNPRRRAAGKLVTLFVTGIAVMVIDSLPALVIVLVIVLGSAAIGRVRPAALLAQLRPVVWLLVAVVVANGLLVDWSQGALVGLRVLVLVTAACVVTLTTRVSELLAVLEAACRPLRVVGLDPTRVGLVLAMTIRFVPLLGELLEQIRQAQRARGGERLGISVITPLLVQTLRFADDLGDALQARGVGDR
jgi:biotin transport system permease protein